MTTDPPGSVVTPVMRAGGADRAGEGFEGLALRARTGDEAAFTQLVGGCAGRLFNFLYRLTGHAQDAEDIAQETLVKAYRALPRYDASRPWLPWLYTIAHRTALNMLRGRRSTEELPETLVAQEGQGSPDDQLMAGDEAAALWDLVRRLRPRYRTVLWLHYGEGLDLATVAGVMNTNRLSTKVLLHRARRALLLEWRQAAGGATSPGGKQSQPRMPS